MTDRDRDLMDEIVDVMTHDEVPPMWVEHYSKEHNRPFYYNPEVG